MPSSFTSKSNSALMMWFRFYHHMFSFFPTHSLYSLTLCISMQKRSKNTGSVILKPKSIFLYNIWNIFKIWILHKSAIYSTVSVSGCFRFSAMMYFDEPVSLLSENSYHPFILVPGLLLGFLSSVALSLFAWTETFFLSFTPLFIANRNGAKVVCHSLDPLWAVHTTGTCLLVSRTPGR